MSDDGTSYLDDVYRVPPVPAVGNSPEPLRPYEIQQGGYWEYGHGEDVYGNGRKWVPVPAAGNTPASYFDTVRAMTDDPALLAAVDAAEKQMKADGYHDYPQDARKPTPSTEIGRKYLGEWVETSRADIPDGARVREIHEGRWRLTPNGKYLDREWRDIRYQVWTEGTP